uniref:Succinate dehydrogenase subunit 3 n=1 Tax=Gossypium raimondii TaxID=29730 RepID=A0A0D2UUL4_GOSRA|nr:hypothetical protein B456_011G157000 [Gossypium raimondii]
MTTMIAVVLTVSSQICRGGARGPKKVNFHFSSYRNYKIMIQSFCPLKKKIPADMFDPLSPTRSLNMMDQVKGNRFLSTSRDIPGLGSEAKESNLRPLSPHLPIYKPQLSATLSITNRISGVFLTTALLFSYLLSLKMGSICFTYSNFYQFFFYSAKLAPVTVSIAALAVSYHLCYGVRHLLADFSGKLR